MNDGREFYVPHPEYVAVSPRMVVIIDLKTEIGTWVEPIPVASMHFDEEKRKGSKK
jgi:hypothetical protein